MAGRVKTVGDLLEELNYLDADTPVVLENGDPLYVGLSVDLKRGNRLVIYNGAAPKSTPSTMAQAAKADKAQALLDNKWNPHPAQEKFLNEKDPILVTEFKSKNVFRFYLKHANVEIHKATIYEVQHLLETQPSIIAAVRHIKANYDISLSDAKDVVEIIREGKLNNAQI